MWVTPPHDSLHRASQETPLGTSGEMLQVVKENEVALMHVVSHRTQPQHAQTQTWQRTSPASPPQQHFTALRDVGVANPQAFRRGSAEQNLAEGLGRRTDVYRDRSVFLFPAWRGLLQTEMTSGCSKRRKLGQSSELLGWGHQYGCKMGSLVHSDVYGKMTRDAKSVRAGARGLSPRVGEPLCIVGRCVCEPRNEALVLETLGLELCV